MSIKHSLELIKQQFVNSEKLVGQKINEIIFYLKVTDQNFTEQTNNYGKSLFNGIDIKTQNHSYSIGNRFTDSNYGLSIDLGQTIELEDFDYIKNPSSFNTKVVNETIKKVNIYWMKSPFTNDKHIYPQEIEIITENGYLCLSSIEVNNKEINTEFTDELLVLDNILITESLQLGEFGIPNNNRMLFNNQDDLINNLFTIDTHH